MTMSIYHAYLLRMWMDVNLEQPAWRASLEDPHTRQVVYFSDLAYLYEYINKLSLHEAQTNLSTPSEAKEK